MKNPAVNRDGLRLGNGAVAARANLTHLFTLEPEALTIGTIFLDEFHNNEQ